MQESFVVVAWVRRGKLRLIILIACLVQIFNKVNMM